MENLNLKESNYEANQSKDSTNQLESPLTDKYDSAESQQSDQSDLDNTNFKDNTNCKNDKSKELNNESDKSNILNTKLNNLTLKDNELNKLNGIKTTNKGNKSNNEILVAQTKERITNKFDSLEKETGLKLKKSGLNFSNFDNNDDNQNDNISLKTQTNYSGSQSDELGCSHDSESVSSFEIKHQSMSAEKVKEKAAIRLEHELERAQKELKLRDEEIAKLSRIRREVEMELEDLTASLFEEANRMVQEAKHSKSKSDKLLKESTLKNEVLQAEVKALKILVRNSIPHTTPTNNNRQGSFKSSNRSQSTNQQLPNSLDSIKNQLTPKLMIKSPKTSLRAIINRTPFHSKISKTNVSKLLKTEKRNQSGYKKSPSNFELASQSLYLNDNQNSNDASSLILEKVKEETNQCINDLRKVGEIDPIYYEEFIEWKKNPILENNGSPFMKRLYEEEIYPVMNFKNQKLTKEVLEAIKQNNIIIELNTDKINNFQKKCALLDLPRICNYRIKINDEWYNISQLCRDRTSAVCDLFCYLRYIQQGLVKSGLTEVYWEIIRRRRNVIFSKLGFSAL